MKNFLRKIIINFNSINKVNKRILVWYIISFCIIFLECLINSRLDINVYFHPLISIFIEILLLINLFFIPSISIAINILKQKKSIIKRILQILISDIGIGLLTLIFLISFSIFNKAVFNIDTAKIKFSNDKIYVEYTIWLESSNHVDVYQIENLFFVRRIDNYKL